MKGYRCIFVMADKQSEEKRALLRAYGAEIVVCPTDVAPDDERSYYRVSDRLARETPGAWKPDQYSNPANPEAHYLTTGPEIWEATDGRVTHFVVALGTGGTVSGAGRFLKERQPGGPGRRRRSGRVGVLRVDRRMPYLTEGIGEDFWPVTYDPGICDVVIRVSDRDSMLTARVATAREGILMGESCGTALWAALQLARRPRRSRGALGGPAAGLGTELRRQALQRRLAAIRRACSAPTRSAADYDWRDDPRPTSCCAATRSRRRRPAEPRSWGR